MENIPHWAQFSPSKSWYEWERHESKELFARMLSKLGSEGWEMVGMSTSAEHGGGIPSDLDMWFKRPMETGKTRPTKADKVAVKQEVADE